MTLGLARLRPLVTALALPVGGIALSYTFFVDPPLRKQIAIAQAKATKLADTVTNRSSEHAANTRALAQTMRAQRELTQLVTTNPKPDTAPDSSSDSSSESSTVENSSIANPTGNVDSPLSTLSAALTLFSRHHLECLASEPASEPASRPNAEPVDRTARQSDHQNNPQTDRQLNRRTVRVTLHGSFADMHGALEEMQSALSCVSIVSLEMEASAAGQTTHRWILILLV